MLANGENSAAVSIAESISRIPDKKARVQFLMEIRSEIAEKTRHGLDVGYLLSHIEEEDWQTVLSLCITDAQLKDALQNPKFFAGFISGFALDQVTKYLSFLQNFLGIDPFESAIPDQNHLARILLQMSDATAEAFVAALVATHKETFAKKIIPECGSLFTFIHAMSETKQVAVIKILHPYLLYFITRKSEFRQVIGFFAGSAQLAVITHCAKEPLPIFVVSANDLLNLLKVVTPANRMATIQLLDSHSVRVMINDEEKLLAVLGCLKADEYLTFFNLLSKRHVLNLLGSDKMVAMGILVGLFGISHLSALCQWLGREELQAAMPTSRTLVTVMRYLPEENRLDFLSLLVAHQLPLQAIFLTALPTIPGIDIVLNLPPASRLPFMRLFLQIMAYDKSMMPGYHDLDLLNRFLMQHLPLEDRSVYVTELIGKEANTKLLTNADILSKFLSVFPAYEFLSLYRWLGAEVFSKALCDFDQLADFLTKLSNQRIVLAGLQLEYKAHAQQVMSLIAADISKLTALLKPSISLTSIIQFFNVIEFAHLDQLITNGEQLSVFLRALPLNQASSAAALFISTVIAPLLQNKVDISEQLFFVLHSFPVEQRIALLQSIPVTHLQEQLDTTEKIHTLLKILPSGNDRQEAVSRLSLNFVRSKITTTLQKLHSCVLAYGTELLPLQPEEIAQLIKTEDDLRFFECYMHCYAPVAPKIFEKLSKDVSTQILRKVFLSSDVKAALLIELNQFSNQFSNKSKLGALFFSEVQQVRFAKALTEFILRKDDFIAITTEVDSQMEINVRIADGPARGAYADCLQRLRNLLHLCKTQCISEASAQTTKCERKF